MTGRVPQQARAALAPGAALGLLVVVLAGANVARSAVVPGGWHFGWNLGMGAAALAIGWAAGLRAADLGLDPAHARAGLRLGGAVLALAVVVLAVVVAVPGLRDVLEDDRAQVGAWRMVLQVLVVIPVGTVLVEELMFRGVLHGLLGRVAGPAVVVVAGAVLFGLWHVFPAWRSAGTGSPLDDASPWATAAGTLVATTGAGLLFVWMRVRSRSLLAPILAHVATNSVTFAAAWAVTRL